MTDFVRSHVFEKIAFAAYVVYIISLMCDYYQMSLEIMNAMSYIHWVLSILLIIEIVLRGFGFRKEFFASFWNRFDVVVVIFTILRESNLNETKYFTGLIEFSF